VNETARTRATGRIDVKTYEPQPYEEVDEGPNLVEIHVTETFSGDIEGEGTLEYLMLYQGDAASFSGLERVVGRIGERSGSFVLQHNGRFEGDTARSSLSVVPGSGTGDLRGLRGEGSYVWPHGQSGAITLDYDFE
jgi:hypothetical protein